MAFRYRRIELKLRTALAVGALSLFIFLVYQNSLNGRFHYDDYHSILYNPHIRNIDSIPDYFADPLLFSVDADKAMYRPMLLVSYALNYAFGGYDPKGYLAVNTAIHIVATILVFLLALRLICNYEAALVAAFCFGLHPLSSEPVNYISSRSESLAVMFCLASMYAFISAKSYKGHFFSCVLFCFALMVKSVACVLPFILIIFDFIWKKKRINWYVHGPYWMVLGVYLSTILTNGFLLKSVSGSPRGVFEQAFTQVKALVYYLYLMVMPVSLNVEHQFFVSKSLLEFEVLVCGLFLISLGLILFAVVTRRIFFWMIFGLTFLLPTLIVPLNVLVNEHRLYMSLVAFSMSVAYLLKSRFWHRTLFVIAGLVFCGLVVQRNSLWETEEILWNDSRMKSPRMVRPWVFWGIALGKNGNVISAESAYNAALRIDPDHKTARTNIAAIYLERVNKEKDTSKDWLGLSKIQLENVLSRDPNYREALQNMGSMYFLNGNWAMADSFFTLCAVKHPNYADCAYNIALTSTNRGEYQRAKRWIQRGIELESNEESWSLLGRIQVKLDALEEAVVAYRRALSYSGPNINYMYNLAEILLVYGQRAIDAGSLNIGSNRWTEAKHLLEDIISLNPDHSGARVRLIQLAELSQ